MNINRLKKEVNSDNRSIKELKFEISNTSCKDQKQQLELIVRKKSIVNKYDNITVSQKLQWKLYDKYRNKLIKEARKDAYGIPTFNCVIFEENSYSNDYFVFDNACGIRNFVCLKFKNLDAFRYIEKVADNDSLIFFLFEEI